MAVHWQHFEGEIDARFCVYELAPSNGKCFPALTERPKPWFQRRYALLLYTPTLFWQLCLNVPYDKLNRVMLNLFYILSFLSTDVTSGVEIIPHGRQCVVYSTYSIPWLLMIWRLKEPRHQQSRYWSGRPVIFRLRHKRFKNQCHPSYDYMR